MKRRNQAMTGYSMPKATMAGPQAGVMPSPILGIGTLPRMMNHPSLTSGSLRRSGRNSDVVQAATTAAISRRKEVSTEASVPSWVTAVNAAPRGLASP
ncbi:hypothetical protein ACWF0M_05320 [Kribbella sp. NPDC055110]